MLPPAPSSDPAPVAPAHLAAARRRDAADPLRGYPARFYHPPDGSVYLDGNSLGLLCAEAEAAVLRVLAEWKERAIGGWLDGAPPWLTMAEELAGTVAGLVGAEPAEVAVANSTTVNLHQLLATLRPGGPGGGSEGERRRRRRLVSFAGEFPSDRFALQSHLRSRGDDPAADLCLLPPDERGWLDETALVDFLRREGDTVAALVLPAVVYTTGQLLDVARLTAAAHAAGALAGFDLSHSVGAVPHALSAAGVDFAFWCHYKYLNAGPGAVGGLFLHRRHFGRAPGLAGWWGARKERMFAPDLTELPAADGAAALQVGTPPVLSMAALGGALSLATAAGLGPMREKSLALTSFLRELVEADPELAAAGFRVVTPREDHRRGGHLAVAHPEAGRLCRALKEAGVVADHRPPDILRFAPTALTNSFVDCAVATARLGQAWRERRFAAYPRDHALVP